jgi:hypothetical protein
LGPSRKHPGKGQRSVPEAWEGTEYGGTVGFRWLWDRMAVSMPPFVGQTYRKHGDPSNLHSRRLGKGPRVGTLPLGGTNGVGTVVPSMAMGTPSLRKPIGRSGDPTQPVHSPLVLLTGRHETGSGPVFRVSSRFYEFLGVGPGVQKLFPCYLMGFGLFSLLCDF